MLRRAAFFVLFAIGCSASSQSGDPTPLADTGSAGDAGDAGAQDTGSSTTEGGIDFDGSLPDAPPPDPAPAAAVYAHSSGVLYKLDPDTKAVTVIGPFSGCGAVVDIALDAKSNLYASAGGIFLVDKTTAKCTRVGGGSFAGNSLSFVPAGTLDPTNEVLVTYSGGQYMRVDIDKGTTTPLGSLPSGYHSSGDIVSVKGGGTYLTVIGNGCGDCLLEVDPKTGAMVKNWGSLGVNAVYGVAYWAGSVYAFNDSGRIYEVTFDTGKMVVKEIPIPSKPPGLSFWGAGSTTVAPVVKVK